MNLFPAGRNPLSGNSGRFDLELSAPVLERDMVFGRFLASFAFTAAAIGIGWAIEWMALKASADVFSFRYAYLILVLQAFFTCAAGVCASAFSVNAAAGGATTVVLVAALPRVVFHASLIWSKAFRETFAAVPFEAHAGDFASGDLSIGTMAGYVIAGLFMLFAASKRIAMARFCGRGARFLRWTSRTAIALGAVFTALALAVLSKYDWTISLETFPEGGGLSDRTRAIISDGSGTVRITAFLSRKDPSFPQVSHLMRRFEAAAIPGGMDISTAYLDPRWDIGEASRLSRLGVKEGSVVFERGRRRSVVEAPNADERTFAGALQSLMLPVGREDVYFITGHGEAEIADYSDLSGLSDLARDLRRDGYGVKTLSIAETQTIPGNAACLVSAGAREGFSTAEKTWLDGYLGQGGRMLVFIDKSFSGAAQILEDYGLAPLLDASGARKTSDGANILAEIPKGHAITDPLASGILVFSKESCAMELPAEENASPARYRYTALAQTGNQTGGVSTLAAAVETGSDAAQELGYRPMRIVTVLDASFPVNASVKNRANSNRDFVLNAIAWLSGLDTAGESGTGSEILSSGMDRKAWLEFSLWTCLAAPLAVLLAGLAVSPRSLA